MLPTFIDDDTGFIRWRETYRRGYIVNHDRAPNPRYMKLHRTTCVTLQGVVPRRGDNGTTTYAKTCSDDLGELRSWAGTFGGDLEPCQTCAA
jgi:hypothetical protein